MPSPTTTKRSRDGQIRAGFPLLNNELSAYAIRPSPVTVVLVLPAVATFSLDVCLLRVGGRSMKSLAPSCRRSSAFPVSWPCPSAALASPCAFAPDFRAALPRRFASSNTSCLASISLPSSFADALYLERRPPSALVHNSSCLRLVPLPRASCALSTPLVLPSHYLPVPPFPQMDPPLSLACELLAVPPAAPAPMPQRRALRAFRFIFILVPCRATGTLPLAPAVAFELMMRDPRLYSFSAPATPTLSPSPPPRVDLALGCALAGRRLNLAQDGLWLPTSTVFARVDPPAWTQLRLNSACPALFYSVSALFCVCSPPLPRLGPAARAPPRCSSPLILTVFKLNKKKAAPTVDLQLELAGKGDKEGRVSWLDPGYWTAAVHQCVAGRGVPRSDFKSFPEVIMNRRGERRDFSSHGRVSAPATARNA
ncbi:hypothetical protein DFH09DRAFT_1327173 [Mycena vulgaris]|nr:hypothetical protein DFH09DRAFT_1327173 [Mycena vulgaris]